MKKSKEYYLHNAISCWLYHFPDHEWKGDYEKLKDEFNELVKVQERGHSAEKQRTQKTTSPKTSTKKSQSTQT